MRFKTFLCSTPILFVSSLDQSNSFIYCKFYECSDGQWISNNISKLRSNLKNHLFGQHLVQDSVPKLIKGHITNPSPRKPLVLSFHGSTGTGKTLVSQLIAQSLYTNGLNSGFVKFINVPHLFRDRSRTREFAERLHHIIVSSLDRCEQTLFIFEDIHAMNPDILDELLVYTNYPLPLDGIEFRKAIYIFLSNSGATRINEYLNDQFLIGRDRSSIGQMEMHKIINERIFQEDCAFNNTEFVTRDVIDAAIPFLPLEKIHVQECIEKAILERKKIPTPSMVSSVLKDIEFMPGSLELFSKSGCKRIDQIITNYFDE